VTREAARDEFERACESLFGDRIEAKLVSGENEGACPDPVREPRVGALEVERVRRQRRPSSEEFLPVGGELEALARSVFALPDPEQLWRCVERDEGGVRVGETPDG